MNEWETERKKENWWKNAIKRDWNLKLIMKIRIKKKMNWKKKI